MRNLKESIVRISGIDSAILFTVASRLVQGLGGIIAVYFIAKYLNINEQGYYYTFASILALQVFFELGLSTIITQYTSKYFSGLEIIDKKIVGDVIKLSYLSSILLLSIKWFCSAAVLLFFLLSFVGSCFFNSMQTDQVNWFYPWIMTCFSTSLILLSTPLISFIAGLNKIEYTSKVTFYQYLFQLVFMIVFFRFGFGLYARPLSLIISIIIVFLLLYKSVYFSMFFDLFKKKLNSYQISYKKDIFPYQWKITVSWLSGYLIFQLFNPVIFAFDGSVAAGKMGMTLVMLTGIQTVAISWISTKIPLFAQLASTKSFTALDGKFKGVFLQSTILCVVGLVSFIGFVLLLKQYNSSYLDKFLSLKNIIILSLGTSSNHIMSCLAIYLRSYLKEPLMKMSIVAGILVATGSLLSGKLFGVDGVVLSYSLVMCFVCVPWTIFIYRKCKNEWQNIPL